jgi:hypothetical protein
MEEYLMRNKIALLLVVAMVTILAFTAFASAEPKIGQAEYAAHGTKAFCVATVIVDGDKIVDALINEYQFVDPATFTSPVPNPDTFKNADGFVLASKRLNSEAYSANMATKGGATQPLLTSYQAIEAFVTGKTIAELEAFATEFASKLEGKEDADKKPIITDAVSGSTLTDTLGYIQALIAAAKNAQ